MKVRAFLCLFRIVEAHKIDNRVSSLLVESRMFCEFFAAILRQSHAVFSCIWGGDHQAILIQRGSVSILENKKKVCRYLLGSKHSFGPLLFF
jgi:hypothetical protein